MLVNKGDAVWFVHLVRPGEKEPIVSFRQDWQLARQVDSRRAGIDGPEPLAAEL